MAANSVLTLWSALAGLQSFFYFGVALVDGVEVGEEELGVDDVDVVEGLTPPATWITSGSSKQRTTWQTAVGGAYVTEELVAQPLALARALDQARDVDELHGGGDEGLGLDELGDFGEALIGHGRDDAGVGINGAEGIVLAACALAEVRGVEDRRFSDVEEANDSAVQWHCVLIPSCDAPGVSVSPASGFC